LSESGAPAAAPGPIPAPDLDGAVDWLNVAAPISMAQLRGKVVIIDFWTYGCVNCMHVLRDLKTLEQRFRYELVVIGVHSPKFTNERDSENLKRILVRYEIEHPVANDANLTIWRRYGAQAWPTRVIIDPAGNLVGTAMGEGNLEGFVAAVRTVIGVFDQRGEIDRSPLPHDLERRRHADRPLLYPAKVLADAASNRLFISDSSHNRIVVATLDGQLIETIGSGWRGDADGIFTQARFHRPQGLALDGDMLYVADTENNRIRAIDLQARAVHTLPNEELTSPWDLALKVGILIVAMAGRHQIWVIDLLHDRAYPYAGTGEEGRRDGPVNEACFAQPSGLAIADNTLYVADAEANAIRVVQHPLGVAVSGGLVYIADTYNHKIKSLDPRSAAVTTMASGFYEPGGISIAGGRIYVADTNHHEIKTVDVNSGQVASLPIDGLTPPEAWSYLRPRQDPQIKHR
jgi:DNA-binding beta-propeller fold protein YncE